MGEYQAYIRGGRLRTATGLLPTFYILESPYMNLDRILKTGDHEKRSAHKSGITELGIFLEDGGGRRTGFKHRRFLYDAHIPERRSGAERRTGEDRRVTVDSHMYSKGRRGIESKIDS
jgi:hypothetical protein